MPKSNKKPKEIYLDYASATPIDVRVLGIITKISKENFANAGAIHDIAVKSKKILEEARENIAQIFGGRTEEIIFTSGATESNNLAIFGVLGNFNFIPHIVTTNIEHASVLEVCKYLEKTGRAEVTYVPVEPNGIVDPKKIKKAIKENTVLVSVMYANNEIGTIQPIREIAKEIRQYRKGKGSVSETWERDGVSTRNFLAKKYPYSERFSLPFFHTDATQAINYLPVNVEKLGVDLLSFNGAKIYGPKGVGVLYIKKGTLIEKIMHGGEQENNFRSGTENLPAITGFSKALSISEEIKEKEIKRLTKLRDYFFDKLEHSHILKNVGMIINGDEVERLPNNVNITIAKISSDLLVIELSAHGIYISEKSACKSGDKKPSHVIGALRRENLTSLRFSLGRDTTKQDIDYTVKNLETILKKLKKWYD